MRTVLITGAAQGVGRATVLEFARLGYRIAAVDYQEEGLMSLKEKVEKNHVEILTWACDVSDEQRVREVCREAVAAFGTVDVLVNNAGLWRTAWGRFLETDSQLWKRLIDVNILGTMYFSQALLPGMVENHWGRVINVGSIAGEYGLGYGVPYSMTKGAVSSFTKALAKDVGPDGITVNAIVPGTIRSTESDGDEAFEGNALRRRGLPEECAKLIAFLASDDAGYIAGQNYCIDGGRFHF